MADRLFGLGLPGSGAYIDPVTGRLTLAIGGGNGATPAAPQSPPLPVDANLITAPGMGQGQYPAPLAAARRWFDPESYGVTGDLKWEQPSALLPMKMHPDAGGAPVEAPAIPRAFKEAAQYGIDLLASPWTGGVPESFVANTALNAVGGPVDLSQPLTFLGRTAKNFPVEEAKRAVEMAKGGLAAGDVYRATGVHPGLKSTSKNPFFEISDKAAEYRPGAALRAAAERTNTPEGALSQMGWETTLGEIYDHPELYANHPELAQTPVKIGPRGNVSGTSLGQGYLGAYNPRTGTLELSGHVAPNLERGKSIIVHEIQHAVQDLENWPSGGNAAYMENMFLQGGGAQTSLKIRDWVKQNPPPPGYDAKQWFMQHHAWATEAHPIVNQAFDPKMSDATLKRYAKVGKAGAGLPEDQRGMELYKRLAGEWQARMAQARMERTPGDLRLLSPERHSDWMREVPQQAQIAISGKTGQPLLQGQKAPEGGKPGNPFFDFGRPEAKPTGRGLVPQEELPRFVKPPTPKFPTGFSDRMAAALGNKKLETALKRITEQGIEMGGRIWYDAEPLRQAFAARLGEDKGNFEFARLMEFVGATSPQQKVPFNIRTATAYYIRDRQLREGRPGAAAMPEPWQVEGKGNWKADITEGRRMENPYGGYTAGLWQRYAQNVHHGRPWPLTAPKPPSFAANLRGNIKPYTADMHDFRQIGILSGDPRWLTKEARDRGVTPKTAKPTDWEKEPNIGLGEYVGAETIGQRLAKFFGIPEAHVQAARWIGGGKLTGLGSDETKAFMDFVMDRLKETAKKRQITPLDALNRLIDGDQALLAETGLRPGMGQYLSQESKQPPPTGDRLLQAMGPRS